MAGQDNLPEALMCGGVLDGGASVSDYTVSVQREVVAPQRRCPTAALACLPPQPKVRLQPEPSFVLPNPQVALRQKMSAEVVKELCRNFPKEEFAMRCYRESAVMPNLVVNGGESVIDVSKMAPHIKYSRQCTHRQADSVHEVLHPGYAPENEKVASRRLGVAEKITGTPAETSQADRLGFTKRGSALLQQVDDAMKWTARDFGQVCDELEREDMLQAETSTPRPPQPALTSMARQASGIPDSSPSGSVMAMRQHGIERDWRVMQPEDLQDELEIAMALGRLKPVAPGGPGASESTQGLRRRRFADARANALQSFGLKGAVVAGHPPRPTKPRGAKATKPPDSSAPVMLGEGETSGAFLQKKQTIGERLYRLGLNPLKRPKGSSQGKRPGEAKKHHLRFHLTRDPKQAHKEFFGEGFCWRSGDLGQEGDL